ncbi:MAG: insulinase family protein [Crenarchaeota archaeon]|nr:insulinase family protein [Thermoproteota archaeon]
MELKEKFSNPHMTSGINVNYFSSTFHVISMSTNLVWHRKKLSNGLTVLLYSRPFSNTVQLSVGVKYGSNQEPKEQAGIAHFLEHMLAGGSDQRIKLSRKVENHGGILDFYTDREQVLGTMDVTTDKLPEAATILSDLFFGEQFDANKFKTERKIILNELAEVKDDPVIRVEEILLENLFRKHPVRYPVGGYPKTVKKLTFEQLLSAYRVNYIPQNMILVLSGNVSQEKLVMTLNGFRDQQRTGNPQRPPVPVETFKPKTLVVKEKAGITQSYLSLGARTVPANNVDTPVLDLISTLLAGGTSARLFIELREKHAVTYDVMATHSKGTDFGYFSISCAVKNSKVKKARTLILRELFNLQLGSISEEELERAKQIMLGGILRAMDNPHDCYEIITFMEMQYGSEFALKEYIDKIKAVSCEDIRRATIEYLGEDSLCTAILNPVGSNL